MKSAATGPKKAVSKKAAGFKKLPTSVIAKASKAKSAKSAKSADPVPAAVIALLESNPFSSVIMVESEGKEGPLMLLVPDFCPKACGWSALDDGDVNVDVAEAAVAAHEKSKCKLVKPADFKGLKADSKAVKSAKAAIDAHVHSEDCAHGVAPADVAAPKAKKAKKSSPKVAVKVAVKVTVKKAGAKKAAKSA